MDVDISLLLGTWNGEREGGFVVRGVTVAGGRGRAVQERRTIDSIEASRKLCVVIRYDVWLARPSLTNADADTAR